MPDVIGGDWTARSGFEAGTVLARDQQVSAVLAANDNMALGLPRALSEHGRRVPEEVSVVGFDDMDESAYLTQPLATVHQDFDEVGRHGLELPLERLYRGESAAGSSSRRGARVVIQPRLVLRQSTARAPERAGRATRRRRAPAGERSARNRTDERR